MKLLVIILLLISCGKETIIKEYKGIDGNSCYVTQNELGALITCTDGSNVQVNNGQDTIDAEPIQVIELCKNIKNKQFTEIAIKFPAGKLVAYAAWGEGFLTVLELNTYYLTTDGYSCSFYVDNTGNIIYN